MELPSIPSMPSIVFTATWDHLDVVLRLDSLRGDQRSLLLCKTKLFHVFGILVSFLLQWAMSASSNHVVLSGPIVDAIIHGSTKGLADTKGERSPIPSPFFSLIRQYVYKKVPWHRYVVALK